MTAASVEGPRLEDLHLKTSVHPRALLCDGPSTWHLTESQLCHRQQCHQQGGL